MSSNIKEIPLTQGKVALVDEDDYEELSRVTWYAHKRHDDIFYAKRKSPRINKKQYDIMMHNDIMKPSKGFVVDHIDGDGLNNCKSNLRICTPAENARNCRKFKKPTSSVYKGVTLEENRWRARIRCNGKKKSLGRFATQEEAARAYDRAAREIFGEFARTNFPD